jgi:eukaryotic-like serine/threonine-protein kinase
MCDRFEAVNDIVEEALDRPASEREPFVESRCAGDREMREDALRLLGLADTMEISPRAPAEEIEIRPGARLGRLRIVRQIGRGGEGSIFLAEHDEHGPVAIKALHPELRRDRPAMACLRAELAASGAVAHPNVCPVFDLVKLGERDGSMAFMMKYLPGETLAARLRRGAIKPAEAFEIARGIAAGLDALHAKGIVHRDLKPDNIMLTRKGGKCVPVIMDFGLAIDSTAGGGDEAGKVVGTAISGSPAYMAPEQFRTGAVTPAADIYAFGLILFEMLAGARPFPAEGLLQAAIRRNTEDAPLLPTVAGEACAAWERAIARSLSRDPGVRPHSAGALLDQMHRRAGALRSGLSLRCRHGYVRGPISRRC